MKKKMSMRIMCFFLALALLPLDAIVSWAAETAERIITYSSANSSKVVSEEIPETSLPTEVVEVVDEQLLLTCDQETDTSVSISWSNTVSTYGASYDIYLDSVLIEEDVTGSSYVVNGLDPASEHDFSIQAKDSDGNIIMSSNTLSVVTDLRISENYTLWEETNVGNLYIDSGTFDVNGQHLNISGNLIISGGKFIVNGGTVNIEGDLRLQTEEKYSDGSTYYWYGNTSGYLIMKNESDYVLVNGDFVTESRYSHKGNLTNGILELKGDFSQYWISDGDNFVATENHRVVLSGDKLQSVNMDRNTVKFATLELRNYSDGGVCFNQIINADVFEKNGCKISFVNSGEWGWQLTEDDIYSGDLNIMGGTLDLNGYKLTVDGNLTLSDGTIDINGGELDVTGDYSIKSLYDSSCTGILKMTNENDLVKIKGSFDTKSSVDHSAYLSAGVLEIGGNINTTSYSSYNFHSTGTLTVVLNGNTEQIINISSTYSGINNLKIMNTSAKGVSFNRDTYVEGALYNTNSVVNGSNRLFLTSNAVLADNTWPYDLCIYQKDTMGDDWTIGGSLYFSYNTSFDLDGHKLDIGDDLVLNYGNLYINGGQLYIGRDMRVQGFKVQTDGSVTFSGASSATLQMDNEKDHIVVYRDFIFNSRNSHNSSLSNGILEIKGDFTQIAYSSSDEFYATDNHKVVLSGDKKQTISFETPGSRFAILELKNTSAEGVYVSLHFDADRIINNGCKLEFESGGRAGWVLNDDETVDSLDLLYGTLDLNGHKLTVKGDLTQWAGIIDINGGVLEVLGDYKIETSSSAASSGILKMTNENDRVIVMGSFSTRSTSDHRGYLTAGIMEVSGDFYEFTAGGNSYANFVASDSHTTILNGSEKQTISFQSSTSRFGNLKIENTSEEGVSFASNVYVDTALYNTDSIVYGSNKLYITESAELADNAWPYDLTISYYSKPIESDWMIGGSLYITGGTIDLNGHKLTVGNNLLQTGGTLNINGGEIAVGADVALYSGTLYINGGKLSVEGDLRIQYFYAQDDGTISYYQSSSNGYLRMINENDYVKVNNDFVMYSYYSHDGYLTNGTLEIGGDFTQSFSDKNFYAKGSHKVIFSGDKKQTISIASPNAHFSTIELLNTSDDGVYVLSYFNADQIVVNDSKLEFSDGGKAGWTLKNDETIEGLNLVCGTLDLNGHKLTVKGDLLQLGGVIDVNGGELEVIGDYKIQSASGASSTGVLKMTNVDDLVRINGSFVTSSTVDHSPYLTAGTLEVSGNLYEYNNNANNFRASGTHTIVLNGKEKQTIKLVSQYVNFGILKIENTSEDGVCFESKVSIDTALYDTDSIVHGSSWLYLTENATLPDNTWSYDLNMVSNNRRLYSDWTIGGSLYMRDGYFYLNGHTLEVGNDLGLCSAVFYVNQGQLYVGRNLMIQETVMQNDGRLEFSGYSSAYFIMTNPNDYVQVNRTFTMCSSRSHEKYLTNGVLEIKGDFNQISYNSYNFYATGNHKVIFSGDSKQTIYAESPYAHFAIVELQNSSDDGVYVPSLFDANQVILNNSKLEFANGGKAGWTLQRDETVEGFNLVFGTLDLNGYKLTVKGDITQSGGIIDINGGELEVIGDYRIETPGGGSSSGILKMTDENDYVKINGSFITRSTVDHLSYLSAGELEIHGDIYEYNPSSFNLRASGTHTIVLNGTEGQTVKLSIIGRLNNLVIANTSNHGVNFDAWTIINGQLYDTDSVVRGSHWLYLSETAELADKTWPYDLGIYDGKTLNNDWSIGGSLYIYNSGGLNLNGHRLDIEDDLVLYSGILDINGGQVYIGRDLRIQSYSPPYNGSITFNNSSNGYLKMTNENDYVKVNRNFMTYANNSHEGYLTNGVLEIKGDFTQSISSSYYDQMNFYARDNHKVVLNGTKIQNVNFGGTTSKFNILEINKPLETGYVFNSVPVWNKLVETIMDTQAPSAPQNLTYDIQTYTLIRLKWEESTDDTAVIGYDVYRDGVRIASTDKTEYLDEGLISGKTYTYYVVAYDVMRNESEWSNILQVSTAVDENAPTRPTDFVIKSLTESSVVLTWTASTDNSKVEGYAIYRNDVLIGTVKGTTFTDNSITNGYYIYYIKAFDDHGNYSEASDTIIIDTEAPTAPVLNVESSSNSHAELSWTASDNIGIAKYEVYRDGEKIATVTDNTYTDRMLSYDNTYEYYVVAYDDAGNTSEQSNVVSVYTGEDTEAPRITAITPSSGVYAKSIPIKVYATDNYSVASVTLQTSSDNTNWENAIVIDADGKTSSIIEHDFDLSGYYDGTLYIRAIAEDSKGNTSDVALSPTAKYTVDNTAPSAPLNVSASEVNGQLEIRWDNSKAPDLDYYRIYKAISGSDNYTRIQDKYMYLNYFDNDIELGEIYDYYVTAVDMAGNESIKSEIVTCGIEKDVVDPQILSVVPTHGSKIGDGRSMSISCKDNFKLGSILVEISPEGSEAWDIMYIQNLSEHAEIVKFELDMSNRSDGLYNIRIKVTDQADNESDYYTTTLDYKSCSIAAPKLNAVPKGWQIELNWSATDDPSLAGYTIYKRSDNNNKFTVLERTVLNEFTDNQVVAGKSYFYYVEAMDTYGNVISSENVIAIPTDEDETPPIAVAGLDLYGISGTSISFDGSASSDNHYIESYEWDFGDGTTESVAKANHIYDEEGIYTATLTVKDSAGNFSVSSIKVTVYDSNEYTFAQFRLLDSRSNSPVSNAMVHVDLPDGETLFKTDGNGNIRIIAPEGTYKVSFYKDGYLPVAVDAVIEKNGAVTIVYIENGQLVTGEMTVERLTPEEAENRGVDLTDPDNQYVYKHEVEAEYNGRKGKFTYVTNGSGEIIDVVETWIDDYVPSFGNNSSNSGSSSSSGSGGSRSYTAIPSGDPSQPPSIAILNVTTTVSWLKEFFGVDLTICNNASPEFAINQANVKLNVPSGLSLAKTTEDNSAYKDLGIIRGGNTVETHWTIRGDTAGEYMISADFSGYLTPFNAEVNVTFKPDEAITVIGGNALKLEIKNRVWNETRKTWVVEFTLTNVSDITIYNPSINYSGYAEFVDVSDMTLVYPNGIIEIIPWEDGNEVKENIVRFLPALLRGDESESIVLKPGDSIVGSYTARR